MNTRYHWKTPRWMGLALLTTVSLCAHANAQTPLEAGFRDPPNNAKPRTWMHAMSGNMSKVGMTKDLEALAAAGQGGILLFNVATGIPYGDVAYNSDEHHEIIAHAAKECERLNLSFGVHNCDGWSSSGGPWITPEQSMKMVVWSETVVDGGKAFSIKLPQPTTRVDFYKDIAVLAYPALKTEIIDAQAKPVATASDKDLDIALVTDNRMEQASRIRKPEGKEAWILFDYGKPHTIQSAYASFFTRDGAAALEISDDGTNFTFVKDLRTIRTSKTEWNIDDQFEPVTARYFRFNINKTLNLLEVNLRATRPFDNYLNYTGYGNVPTDTANPFTKPTTDMVIKRESIINLTSSLQADGTLDAKLPNGKWTILRFGETSTGAQNSPASIWGRGLECDKFSRAAYKTHFDAFCQRVIDDSKADAPNALQYMEIDSYEMGGQNWTEGFEDIFEKEKGYEIIPFLPAFAGRYVESAEAVTGFVYDLNDLYCELMTKNYFGYFTELCNENGLQSYVEPYGHGPVSTLDICGRIDLPMTEFWMSRPQTRLHNTVSGAHIYGKQIISAESFTSRPELNWKMHPALTKSSGDEAWTAGVNEFMFHRFVHQSNPHVEPGVTMGQWGSHIDRTQTWWMSAGKSWFDYIARGQHLLRQGYPVADVLIFMGDGPHKEAIHREKLTPELPIGLNYDCTNADVLLNRISIKDRTLVLPEGNAYHYLILQDVDMISLPSLRRIQAIVDAGVPVIGNKPTALAGYNNTAKQTAEFNQLCEQIWSKPNSMDTFDFSSIQSDFEAEGQELNFMHRRTNKEDIYFFYNKDEEQSARYECTFRVANKIPELWDATTGAITKLAHFRSEGETTRVWLNLKPLESAFVVFRSPVEKVDSIVKADKDQEIYLTPESKAMLVSASPDASTVTWSNGKTTEIPAVTFPASIDLSTDWEVAFLHKHHFPSQEKFAQLTDWKDHENEAIKYYSGTAVYSKTINIKKVDTKGLRYVLDLGSVDIVAEVLVNGQSAGVLWIAPFEVDITELLQQGENQITVKVTNQWSNRLIGDEHFPRHDQFKKASYHPDPKHKMPEWFRNNEPMPAGPRTTFCTYGFYRKGDELVPSGLKGPVRITYKRVINLSDS